ncbi:hypothetical protein Ddye_005426 [Dipteronia dyeriana]|uniref:Uncharacterized protein n=1 Tax=Dipteronia dyeriana TaxID=168575 RepID=A0AAD9XGG0_9ROSI|nr:hypothetical protein Ddye_005426 [Dipteronia dyeriana]
MTKVIILKVIVKYVTWWDKEELVIAENVCLSFYIDLKIYAFKTLPNSTIPVRIEKMSNKSGSPGIEDIKAFTASYRGKIEKAEIAKPIPENISVEVSFPGVERVVRIPQLDRFKDRAMYVKYRIQPFELKTWSYRTRVMEIEAMIEEIPVMFAPIKWSATNSFAESPFVNDNMMIKIPRKFIFPDMKPYDGMIDPEDNISLNTNSGCSLQ